MALVIVLVILMFLLILGSSYIQSISQIKHFNPKALEQLQSDFFAQGVNRIALLKFKKYPADYYHAFFYEIERKKGTSGLTAYSPWPLTVFNGESGTVTCNNSTFKSPLKIASYSVNYAMISHKPYANDGIEVTVFVQVGTHTRNYKTTVDASRTRIL